MKIIHVLFNLSSGGAERFVVDLSNSMSEANNHSVSIVTIKNDTTKGASFYRSEICNKVKYYNLNRNKFSISTIIVIYKFIKKESPDIVHLHVGNLIFWFILPIILLRKVKYIQTIHSQAQKECGSTFRRLIRKFIYKSHLVSVITISKSNDKSFCDTYNVQSSACIYNGRKNTPLIEYESVKKEIERYKEKKDSLVFCHIARFNVAKNQQMLIETFNELIEEKYNITLLVIGDHFDTEEGLIIKKLANNKIHFLGTRTNITDYLRASDFFCLSSLYEGMPITLIEAFSTGCIPISTPVSGCIDIIRNGENGFLSPDFSKDSYKKTIKIAIKNKDNINREKLIQYYNTNLSINICRDKYFNLYKKILNEQSY